MFVLLVLSTYYADLQKSDDILKLFRLRTSINTQPDNEDSYLQNRDSHLRDLHEEEEEKDQSEKPNKTEKESEFHYQNESKKETSILLVIFYLFEP